MILAAGLGSRLKHITSDIPKALVPVGEKPILAWQLEALKANGIEEVLIVTGYQAHRVHEYLTKNRPGIRVEFVHNAEFNTSNSSYSFWLASSKLSGHAYVHLNCDILFPPTLLQKLIASPHENLIVYRTDIPLGGQLEHVSIAGDRLTAMSITQREDSMGKAFGLAKFGAASVEKLRQLTHDCIMGGDKNQNYFGLIRRAIAELPYFGLDATGGFLLEVNTLNDLEAAENYLLKK